MSDDIVLIIPRDPRHVPAPPVQRRVGELLAKWAPDAADITAEASDDICFFDCGENFQRIGCPKCAADIDERLLRSVSILWGDPVAERGQGE